MRWCFVILALVWTTASAQTIRLSPVALSSVPTGATAANPYWQHLVIELGNNVSAGNTITITLPDSVQVADTDGDGSVEDEISIAGNTAQVTGYRSVAGSRPDRLQLVSTTGGTLGSIHLQFPITTPTSPVISSAIYGPITFSNGGETTIPAGTLTLSFVSPHQLSLAQYSRLFVDGVADTTTSAQGAAYPDSVAYLFATGLPDLVHDDLAILGSNALTVAQVPFGNGLDDDDLTYRFWWSTTDSLTSIVDSVVTAARDAAGGTTVMASERDSVKISLDVSALATGTYYLYMTSNLTGTHPLVRSRGVTIRHDPTVLSVGTFLNGDPDWIDSGRLLDFDNGTPGLIVNARDALVIDVSAIDLDDSAKVRVFYSATGTLDTSSVTTTGTAPSRVISALTGASHVDSSVTLKEGADSTLTWQVAPNDTSVVTAGDYYLYAVITDGSTLSLTRSDTVYRVRHSPLLRFDVRQDTVIRTGGVRPHRYHTITWNQDAGLDGDIDRDHTAQIDLYYSDNGGFALPNGVSALEAAAADTSFDTHRIVENLSSTDGTQADNQYLWDLWSYTNPDGGGVPLEGTTYYLYGVITGGSTERLVRWEDGNGLPRTISFLHEPHVTPLAPVTAVAVDGRRSFEVAWEARDVDESGRIWITLVPASVAQGVAENLSWSDLQTASGDQIWIASSDDGSLAAGDSLSEDTQTRTDVRPASLVLNAAGDAMPLTDGEYHAYIVLDPTAAASPAASSLAHRASGRITIDGLPTGAAGLIRPAVELLPARRTMETWRDTATFAIHPNTDGQMVDVVSVFLSVDTLLVTIVDQDSVTAGVQPFATAAGISGQTLFDSVKVATDSSLAGRWVMDLVYFEQSGISFDGSQPLASITLASRNREGTAQLHVDNLSQRRSAFYRNGVEVGSLAPETGALVEFLPRGTLSGEIRLQGRTQHAEEVTLMLRERNSFLPVSDSLFEATNDVNSTKAGVQDSLDAQGAFNLTSVPTGTYHLAVHVDRYLDGQVTMVQVNPGDQITDLKPTVLRDGVSQAQFLLGGDVTGWVDTADVSGPDNEVDQLDVDFVTTYFGVTTSPTHAGALADVDGDSLVWVEDLNMIAANFDLRGVEPSYRPAAGAEPEVELQRSREGDGRLRVRVTGQELAGMRAYGVRVAYDPAQWRISGHLPGDWLPPGEAIHAYRDGGGLVDAGAARLRGEGSGSTSGSLLELLLEPVSPAADGASVRLLLADLMGDDDLRHSASWVTQSAPSAFALSQNYPNPFNPNTALRLDLPVSDMVHLRIHDATGQVIRTILRDTLPAGMHILYWDGLDAQGRRVGSGIYFARLTGTRWQAERKMLLLR